MRLPATASAATLEATLLDLADRVRNLEHPRTVTLPGWSLTTNADGDLVATNTNTGTTTTIATT